MDLISTLLEIADERIKSMPGIDAEVHRQEVAKCMESDDPEAALSDYITNLDLVLVSEARVNDDLGQPISEDCALEEGVFDAEKGIAEVVILRPGFNRGNHRYYSKEVVKEAAAMFNGVKMFADHASKNDLKSQPNRSIKDWVGTLQDVRVDQTGALVGKAVIIEGWLRDKIKNLSDNSILSNLGISHNSLGKVSSGVINGIKTNIVEKIIKPLSVDFVTEPGAGGAVVVYEELQQPVADSNLSEGDDMMDEEKIKALIESQYQTVIEGLKAEISTLQGVKAELDSLKEENTQLTAKLQDSEKAAFAAHVTAKLAESNLHEVTKDRLKSRFSESVSVEDFDAALKEEAEYAAKLTEGIVVPPNKKVKNMGPSDGTKVVDMTESFLRLNRGNKEIAEAAANL